MQPPPPARKTRWKDIIGYTLGEGATSLTMNGISGFAMLYYTQALGLSFSLAGIAFAVSSIWDALVDPAIGHLSDNTHSRWGRRQPYILLGGVLMGYGARFARGCTSGQALSGGAVLSAGSWVFMLAVFGGAYLVAYFVRKLWN